MFCSSFLQQQNDDLLACRFGTTATVPAKRISSTSLQCVVPSAPDFMTSSGTMHHVSVEITFDGIDFTNDGFSFAYYRDPEIQSITPSVGSEQGGTVVMIEGNGFPRNCGSTGILCKFGDVHVVDAAQWSSPHLLRCIAPAHLPGQVDLSLSFNGGVDYTLAPLGSSFQYETAARITSIHPSTGSVYGGTIIQMTGMNFNHQLSDQDKSENKKFFCQLGTSISNAIVVNTTFMSCQSPPQLKPGSVKLQVMTEDGDFIWSEQSIKFEYLPPLTVSHVDPTWGSIAGGTAIILRGNGMRNMSTTSCLFRRLSVSTASESPGTGDVYEVQAMHLTSFRMSCVAPQVIHSGRYALEVSNNGIEYSSNGLQFEFVQPMMISKVNPIIGSVVGGTIVQIVGSGFINTPNLGCKFGDSFLTKAKYKSAFHISCVSPVSDMPTQVQLTVTVNGVDYSNSDSTRYRYVSKTSVQNVIPSHISAEGSMAGSLLLVQGTSFYNHSGLSCAFRSFDNHTIVTSGFFLNDSAIWCKKPVFAAFITSEASLSIFSSSVSVTDNHQEHSNSISIDVMRIPRINKFSPTGAYSGAHVRVNIQGAHFVASDRLSCAIKHTNGSILAFPTTYVSFSEILCDLIVPILRSI